MYFKKAIQFLYQSPYTLIKLDKRTLKIKEKPLSNLRIVLSRLLLNRMSDATEEKLLLPPEKVKGMTRLEKEAFTKLAQIPGLRVAKKEIAVRQKTWKPLVLKLPGLSPVAELSDKDPLKESHRLILLDPHKLQAASIKPEQKEMLQKLGLDLQKPDLFEVELGYANWSVSDVLRAILPSEVDNVTSFTQIGHIAHLNLKPETLPYKKIIGEVIIDKIASVKTVVNKLNNIDNTYRNFSMELLAGEDNFITQTKEHNCVFELDFAKVYWNSRLSTEHQRIVDLIPAGSVVYDVCAGIGPFAVPLAKKKGCTVLANDLNPASYEWLNKNVKLNNVRKGSVDSWNLDGRDFIKTVVKERLERTIKEALEEMDSSNRLSQSDKDMNKVTSSSVGETLDTEEISVSETRTGSCKLSYVIMNLPAIAVEFLDAFPSLLSLDFLNSSASKTLSLKAKQEVVGNLLPHVFCYAFSPNEDIETGLRARVEKHLGKPLPPDSSLRVVRNVAPNKEMICISFKLWPELVMTQAQAASSASHQLSAGRERDTDQGEVESKKLKLNTD